MRLPLLLVVAATLSGCGGTPPKETATAVVTLPTPPVVPDASAPPVERHAGDEALQGSKWTDEDLGPWGSSDLVMTLNLEQIRKHPDASRLSLILGATSQWNGILGTRIDAVRDLDWVRVAGPSLVDTTGDVMLAHVAMPDAAIDKTLASRGAALALPGVKAWKLRLGSSDVAVMHLPSGLVAVAPLAQATSVAHELTTHPPPAPPWHADEAMRLRALHPSAFLVVLPNMPQGRLWVDSHAADASADVYFEGDCASDVEARKTADSLRTRISAANSFPVRLLTAGILNHVEVSTVGDTVRLHMPATQEQLEAVLLLTAARVGVTLPPKGP